jgi:hypothetical protein
MTQRKRNAKVAVYVGCRDDVVPLLVFPEVKQWIFIDALPDYTAALKDEYINKKVNKKDMYLNSVENKMSKVNFTLKHRDEKERLLVFVNGPRECWFFYSTFDPDYTPLQKRLMKKATYLYVSAFTPEFTILKLLNPNLTLWIHEMPLYYDFRRKDKQIQFETDKSLSTYLMQHFVNGLKYVYVYDELVYSKHGIHGQLNAGTKIKYDIRMFKKIPCTNLLDYVYKNEIVDKKLMPSEK